MFLRATIIFLVFMLAGCATSIEATKVRIPMGERGWKIANAKDLGSGKGTIVEAIRKDETLSNWGEMVTIQFIENPKLQYTGVMNELKEKMVNRCPDVKWDVIEKNETSILYEWSIIACAGNADQNELARLMQGNDGVHRVAYTKKGGGIDAEAKGSVKKALLEAYVEKGGKRITVLPR